MLMLCADSDACLCVRNCVHNILFNLRLSIKIYFVSIKRDNSNILLTSTEKDIVIGPVRNYQVKPVSTLNFVETGLLFTTAIV